MPSDGDDSEDKDQHRPTNMKIDMEAINNFNKNIDELYGALDKYSEMQSAVDNLVGNFPYEKAFSFNNALENYSKNIQPDTMNALDLYLKKNEQLQQAIQEIQIDPLMDFYINLAVSSTDNRSLEGQEEKTNERIANAEELEETFLEFISRYVKNSSDIFSEEKREYAADLLETESKEDRRELFAEIISECDDRARMALYVLTRNIIIFVIVPMVGFETKSDNDDDD